MLPDAPHPAAHGPDVLGNCSAVVLLCLPAAFAPWASGPMPFWWQGSGSWSTNRPRARRNARRDSRAVPLYCRSTDACLPTYSTLAGLLGVGVPTPICCWQWDPTLVLWVRTAKHEPPDGAIPTAVMTRWTNGACCSPPALQRVIFVFQKLFQKSHLKTAHGTDFWGSPGWQLNGHCLFRTKRPGQR